MTTDVVDKVSFMRSVLEDTREKDRVCLDELKLLKCFAKKLEYRIGEREEELNSLETVLELINDDIGRLNEERAALMRSVQEQKGIRVKMGMEVKEHESTID